MRQGKFRQKGPNTNATENHLNLSRKYIRTIIGLLTGQYHLQNLHTIGIIKEYPGCRLCGSF